MTKLIGIAGGIGCGKSVVSRCLRLRGYTVYDCDAEAKRIMNECRHIKCRIRDEISSDVTDGERTPDRKLLAEIVFGNEKARRKLNEIVHCEVREDIGRKIQGEVMWVEAAILAESGLADMCDCIWEVVRPIDERLKYIKKRDNCSEAHARSRILSQANEEKKLRLFHTKTVKIINSEGDSIMQQIDNLLLDYEIKKENNKKK